MPPRLRPFSDDSRVMDRSCDPCAASRRSSTPPASSSSYVVVVVARRPHITCSFLQMTCRQLFKSRSLMTACQHPQYPMGRCHTTSSATTTTITTPLGEEAIVSTTRVSGVGRPTKRRRYRMRTAVLFISATHDTGFGDEITATAVEKTSPGGDDDRLASTPGSFVSFLFMFRLSLSAHHRPPAHCPILPPPLH